MQCLTLVVGKFPFWLEEGGRGGGVVWHDEFGAFSSLLYCFLPLLMTMMNTHEYEVYGYDRNGLLACFCFAIPYSFLFILRVCCQTNVNTSHGFSKREKCRTRV